ncbi:hypothetical protein H6784_03810 [Candidatus Nomurabacteria bacterium]|nr:hypothetical protein [Candidatus Kaiserbacteria bacterium]MCB9814515.1 hypothetical protein [Candidatus Nomurabacteria bacterium]
MKKIITIIVFILAAAPSLIFAAGYTPLVGIPGVNPNSGFDAYMNALYALSISIAALLAVIKIVIAGVKWMMSDVVTDKGSAKKDIQGAVLGLLVILAAVIIITVINPDINNVNVTFDPIPIPSSPRVITTSSPVSLPLGDEFMPLRSGIIRDAAEAKNICENVVPGRCPSNYNPFSPNPEAACYQGEYTPPPPGSDQLGTCIVRAAKKRPSTFDCLLTGTDPVGNNTYDCTAAMKACQRAGGEAEAREYNGIVSCTKYK